MSLSRMRVSVKRKKDRHSERHNSYVTFASPKSTYNETRALLAFWQKRGRLIQNDTNSEKSVKSIRINSNTRQLTLITIFLTFE